MANPFYHLGKRLLISKSRGTVRGSMIFFLTHLLFFIGVIFTAEIIVVLLGVWDVYVPFAGKLFALIP